ncbi:MAG: hypothetical protein GY750_20905 [Lentisphaerae bacterium]|nr:hypothetical protein [Lentisphaerota bacterium]
MTELEKLEYRAKLTQKINAMADAIGQVKAEGRNTHSNYNFVGYEQVNALIRSLSPKFQLNIMPSITDSTETTFQDNKGRQVVRTTVKMSFLLTDTETGYCEERFSRGADQDTMGKSFGQAVTEAQKRFELKLFHISTQADADPDTKNTEVIPASKPVNKPVATMAEYLTAMKVNPAKAFEAMQGNQSLMVQPNQTIETLNRDQQEFLNTNINWFVQNCGV